MLLDLKATPVFQWNSEAKTRIVVNEGGTRSSKTYSLAQLFMIKGLSERGKIFTIARKTLPSLRATAMRDFFDLLMEHKLYNEKNHNKTEMTYRMGSNMFEFISVDNAQKVRGRKRDYLWANETNELSLEDWRQLLLRTSGQIFCDYNPSDEYHWIYDNVLNRDDVTLIKSTYRDNPFIEPALLQEIERLEKEDEAYWRVFGLGERAVSQSKIYSHWKLIDEMPDVLDEEFGALDFGFNNATALLNIGMYDKEAYVDEKLYQTHLTNSMLIDELNRIWPKKRRIYADGAEKQRIEEIKKAGFDIVIANKEVEDGIDTVKSTKVHITKRSENTIREIKKYSWKQKDGKNTDEPVKFDDHAMDAMRYGIHTHKRKSGQSGPRIRTF